MTMPTPDVDELLAYISQLIEATRSGAMSWAEANPSTFIWDTRQPKPARLSLQKVARNVQVQPGRAGYGTRAEISYLLQALEISPSAQILRLSINGAENQKLNGSLDELYKLVEGKKVRDNIEFLKSIIPPPSKT
jgi:hypothetical protein